MPRHNSYNKQEYLELQSKRQKEYWSDAEVLQAHSAIMKEVAKRPDWLYNNSMAQSGKKNHNALGKHRITFDNGRSIVVPNLAEFARERGYPKSSLFYVREGYRDIPVGRKWKGKVLTEPYRVNFKKCNDIIKVELIEEENEDVPSNI